jgi:hypothetical protein
VGCFFSPPPPPRCSSYGWFNGNGMGKVELVKPVSGSRVAEETPASARERVGRLVSLSRFSSAVSNTPPYFLRRLVLPQ